MQAQVSEISPVLVRVQVEVPWETVRKDIDDASKRIAKTAHVKGFRPGKAPTRVVQQVYGKAIRGEVAGQLIEQGLMKAVEEHSLQIVAQPQVTPSDISDGQAFTFTAELEIRPSIDQVVVEGLEVFQDKNEIPDEDITSELERIRRE
jgi:trigger factor